jgi:hypothetical protein
MPTTYTADPTAAPIAPDVNGPERLAVPVIELPLDGEAGAVASIMQALQTLANHVAWHYVPRAAGGDFQYPIVQWSNALNQPISVADPFGFISGPTRNFYEEWPIVFSEYLNTYESGQAYLNFGMRLAGVSNSSYPVYPGWLYGILNTTAYTGGALVSVQPPISNGSNLTCGRTMRLTTAPNIVNDHAAITRFGTWRPSQNVMASLQFTIRDIAVAAGIAIGGWYSGTATADPESVQGGIFLQASAGVANFQLVTRSAGGGSTVTDTGVAVGADKRVRLVYVGSGLDFSGVSRALCYINGTLVANVTATLPGAFDASESEIFAVKTKTASGAALIDVGEITEQTFIRPF